MRYPRNETNTLCEVLTALSCGIILGTLAALFI